MSTEQLIETIDNRPDNEKWPDVMVDLETTGLNKERNAIIQIASIKFNLAEQTVCPIFFNRCLDIPKHRFFDEGTREWWLKDKRETLMSILGKGEHHEKVLKDWMDYMFGGRRFWSKPTHFDYCFIESYLADMGEKMPVHYWTAENMNSFIRGRYFPQPAPRWEKELEMLGSAHDAIYDCLHQINVLFTAVNDTTVSSARYTREAQENSHVV
ncbi:putative exonuclease [Xylophilus phage Lumi]|nr:putative exonuclease [Xylophilus phage Lumi]